MKYTYWILLAIACTTVIDGFTNHLKQGQDLDSCLYACEQALKKCLDNIPTSCPFLQGEATSVQVWFVGVLDAVIIGLRIDVVSTRTRHLYRAASKTHLITRQPAKIGGRVAVERSVKEPQNKQLQEINISVLDNDDDGDDNEGDHYYDYEDEHNDTLSLIILLLLLLIVIIILIFTLITASHADTHSTFTNV
ncbi:hypothetical protein LSAT2_001328 [Lamellibrachia satsuma]|nr:hypothetical protein LSAT2_001328 [Lamellibrachia satsuma]